MKKGIAIIILGIILLNAVFISGVEIKIKTLHNHKLSVQILETGQVYNLLDSYHKSSGTEGEVIISPQLSAAEVDLKLTLSFNGQTTFMGRMNKVSILNPVTIDFTTSEPKIIQEAPPVTEPIANLTNETIANETEVLNETLETVEIKESKLMMTGLNILEKTKELALSKMTYYVVGGFFIMIILGFGVVLVIKKKPFHRSSETFKVTPLSALVGAGSDDRDSRLIEAERKIKEAQAELENIRDKKRKLKEAQDRYEASRAELERLKKEDN
jgi:hypothetical protein